MTQFLAIIAVKLVTPKVAAEQELLFNKLILNRGKL
jgi:hypothetical protein